MTTTIPVRAPFAADALLGFLAARAVHGIEAVIGRSYLRTLRLGHGTGIVSLQLPEDRAGGSALAVGVHLWLDDPTDGDQAVAACRHLLDAAADPRRVGTTLRADPALAGAVRAEPGLRVPGSVDGPEIVIRAIAGQQISVAAARTTLGRWALLSQEPVSAGVRRGFEADLGPTADGLLTRMFPSPQALLRLGPEQIGGPKRRASTLMSVSAAMAAGTLDVRPGRDSAELTAQLVAHPGIGPWTAGYVAMRVLHDSDVLLTGDLALRVGARALGLPFEADALAEHGEQWRPFRAYAGMYLWRAAGTGNADRAAPTARR